MTTNDTSPADQSSESPAGNTSSAKLVLRYILQWLPWLILLSLGIFLLAAPIDGKQQVYGSEQSAEALLAGSDPLLLSFTSASCGACRIMSYQLDDYGDNNVDVPLVRLDVNEHQTSP